MKHVRSKGIGRAITVGIAVLVGCTPSPPPTNADIDGGRGGNASSDSSSTSSSLSSGTWTSSTGSGGSSNGGGWDASTWLGDPDLWVPVNSVTEKLCGIHQAKLPSTKIPRRKWISCGDGCLLAPAILPDSGALGAWIKAIAGSERNGEIYYRVSAHGLTGGVDDVARLSDDEPVAVLKREYGCAGTGGEQAPFLFQIFRVVEEGEPIPLTSIGQGSAQVGGTITWALPGLDLTAGLVTGLFDFDSGWGVIHNQSVVKVALTPTSSALTTIWSSPAYQLHAATRDDIVVWSDFTDWSPTNRAKLRVYTPSDGTAVLVQGVGDPVFAAITADRIVWLEAAGLSSVEGKFESTQVFWSPKTTNPAQVQRNAGPQLPHTETTCSSLIAYGDYTAVVVSFLENGTVKTGVSIGHLLTGKTWFIPERPGNVYRDVIAMNGSWILLKEHAKGQDIYVERIIRLDLSKLDVLAAGGN